MEQPINILIVDDEPKNLTVLETVLNEPGYRLVRANSADQALLALVAEEFALLILDIRMPGMSGFELAEMIKERKKTARVPIIFLTAYFVEDQHVVEGYGTGAVDYLHKPVNPAVLRSKVAVFVELYRKSRALLNEVAERRRAEEQLRELNETLEQRVTERAEALRASEERYRSLFDLGPVAVYTCDGLGVIHEFNRRASELWGRAPAPGETDEQFGSSFKVLLPDGSLLPQEQWPMAEVLSGTRAEVRDMEMLVERPDGSKITVIVNILALRNERGEITGVINCFYDITERRMLEDSLARRAEELARADRMKDEFLAMLAHELRNPLAPLRNATAILTDPEVNHEERGQAQQILGRQIENMSRMVDDLLDVSRITEGRIELRRQPVALEAILTAAASLARSACVVHGQEFTLSLPEVPVFLAADATRLEQVFGNLLANASKYSGDGSRIWLSAELAADSDTPEVIVRVRDDGLGIAPELLPHIFGLFVQASRALDRSHGGLGIGLSLVERLVKLHGGSVEARSKGLGHGSEFIVRLPILTETPVLAAPVPPPVTNEIGRRILIVDDNIDAARSLATLQRRRGHDTRTAFTGPDALTAAAEFLPQVVLLDIGLPGMDGFEVARQIRTMPELKDAFVVAMSGYGREEDLAAAREAGFDDYLVKPLNLARLNEWLGTRV